MSNESAADSIYLLSEPVYFSVLSVPLGGNLRAVVVCTRYDELAYYRNRPDRYQPMTKAEYDELMRQWREYLAKE